MTKRIVLSLLGSAIFIAQLALPATQAAGIPNNGTYVSSYQVMRLCTDMTNNFCVPAGMPAVSANQIVIMKCWQDAPYFGKNMRWFWVSSSSGEGYVTSTIVQRQTIVGLCSNDPHNIVAEAALARMGQTYASAADRTYFTNSEWTPGPVGEWQGDCVKLVYVSWKMANITVPKQNAITNYNLWKQKKSLGQGYPPRGDIAFWSVTAYGHTAIGLGDGYVASTNGLDNQSPVNANSVKPYLSWSSYLGWISPI